MLGYAYSAHQGQINRHLVNGMFHAMGTSRLMAGTVCDSCCETAWDMTLGPVGGADPETVAQSDLIISWGCDLKAVNVHFWQKAEQRQKQGVKVIVIDPRRTRTAQSADWHIPIRIGTDAALAIGIVHILVRDGICDEAYLANHTVGFDRWNAEVVPQFPPARVAEITGLSVDDVERLAAMYGAAQAVVHPHRRGHDAAGTRWPGAARRRSTAGGDGRLRAARRRRAAAHGRIDGLQLLIRAQTIRAGADAPNQP